MIREDLRLYAKYISEIENDPDLRKAYNTVLQIEKEKLENIEKQIEELNKED